MINQQPQRWCIISGARSGSTWLEEMIYNGFPYKNYQIKLGEPLEHSDNYFKSSGHNHTVSLNEFGCLRLSRLPNQIFKNKSEYIDYLIDTFNKGNPTQDIVLKVFTQPWKYSEEEYLKFLSALKNLGFKFINLSRKITDRAVSWGVMEKSKVVHRWSHDNKNYVSTYQGLSDINDKISESLHFEPRIFLDYMNLTWQEDQLKSKILKYFDHVDINYDTIVQDCHKHRIKINTKTKVQKLYNMDYSRLISNYDELIKETFKDEYIKKYGMDNQLYKNKITDTICQFAWDYPVLQIARNDLRQCCRAKGNQMLDEDINKGSKIFTKYEPIIKQRRELLQGIRTEACRSCWATEERGVKSPRSGFGNFVLYVQKNLWKKNSLAETQHKLLNLSNNDIEEIIKIDAPRMIEISLGNTCDLKCVYCNHHYSSQWAAEKLRYKEISILEVEKPLPENDSKFEQAWWEWFETSAFDKINAINFIGGEPLLIEKFHTYINRILDFYSTKFKLKKNIDISVVTNFNTPQKQFDKFLKVTEKIIKTENIKLDFNISMESIGSRAEFIRNGTDWELMTNNLHKFIEFVNEHDNYTPPKIIINLQIALNALCISDLPNFFKFVIDLQKSTNLKINLRQNQVVYPQWNSVFILPVEYGKYIDQCIELLSNENVDNSKYTTFGRWDSYIKFLKDVKTSITNPIKNEANRKDFTKTIDQLVERRKLNFEKTFPEMVEFYNECKLLTVAK
jgi:hypothetical protein